MISVDWEQALATGHLVAAFSALVAGAAVLLSRKGTHTHPPRDRNTTGGPLWSWPPSPFISERARSRTAEEQCGGSESRPLAKDDPDGLPAVEFVPQ